MKSCLALATDADPKLRLAAAKCVNDQAFRASGGFSPDATLGAQVLKLFENEKVQPVHGRWGAALNKLALSGEGATYAIELVKKLKLTDAGRDDVAVIFDALRDGDAIDAAVDEAISVAGADHLDAAREALRLLEGTKTRGPDACKATEAIVVGKKKAWATAALALVSIKPACKPDYDAVIAAIVEKLGEEDSDGTLDRSDRVTAVAFFVQRATLSQAQKAKLSTAAKARADRKLQGEERGLEALTRALKK